MHGHTPTPCASLLFPIAVDTFCKIVNNIISHPTEPKYRRIRLANPTFQEKLWSSIGGPELLQAVGFKVVDDGQYVEMGQGDLDLQTLKRAVEEVRQEVRLSFFFLWPPCFLLPLLYLCLSLSLSLSRAVTVSKQSSMLDCLVAPTPCSLSSLSVQ